MENKINIQIFVIIVQDPKALSQHKHQVSYQFPENQYQRTKTQLVSLNYKEDKIISNQLLIYCYPILYPYII